MWLSLGMIAVIQRVSQASVTIDGVVKGQIEQGFMVLLGVTHTDTEEDVTWLSFIEAARPDVAIPLYEAMITQLSADLGKPIQTGTFGADMKVMLLNDGPVTIIIDTKNQI
jgi:D-tyrosyl-tRNA(Tyr) deacylase